VPYHVSCQGRGASERWRYSPLSSKMPVNTGEIQVHLWRVARIGCMKFAGRRGASCKLTGISRERVKSITEIYIFLGYFQEVSRIISSETPHQLAERIIRNGRAEKSSNGQSRDPTAKRLRPSLGDDSSQERHCEERSDEAIHAAEDGVDCFASLAMTEHVMGSARRDAPAAPSLRHVTAIGEPLDPVAPLIGAGVKM